MKIRIGVFFGGRSVEHEISIISAIQAMNHIDTEKYEIIPIYMAKNTKWYTGEKLRDISNFKNIDKLIQECEEILIAFDGEEKQIIKRNKKWYKKDKGIYIDVAFPIVHGTNVEDGTMEGFFRAINIPFVGTDILGSAVAMDKIVSKKICLSEGINIVPFVDFTSKGWIRNKEDIIKEIKSKLKYPLIVKPANLGSSIGIKTAKNEEELEEAVSYAAKYSIRILVENKIEDIREINCSVLGDYEKQEISEFEEPVTSDEILSYTDKYMNDLSQKGLENLDRKLPADLEEDKANKIESMAIKCFKLLDCSGVIRIDFIIDKATDEIYINEINSIPGSLAFYLWEEKNKKYEDLIEDMIRLALKRKRESEALSFDFNTNILSIKGQKGFKK